jgi:hypothetical protein
VQRWVAIAVTLGLSVAGCRHSRVDSCADDLAGVWYQADDRERSYHLVNNRTGIEIYAMFDSARSHSGAKNGDELYAPVVFDLERSKSPGARGLSGNRSQRVTRAGKICQSRLPAEISRCADNSLTLRHERDRGIDWNRCKAKQTGSWVSLELVR